MQKDKIAQIVGEYFFAVRRGESINKADIIPKSLSRNSRLELKSTFSFIDSLVKLRKIEQGEAL